MHLGSWHSFLLNLVVVIVVVIMMLFLILMILITIILRNHSRLLELVLVLDKRS